MYLSSRRAASAEFSRLGSHIYARSMSGRSQRLNGGATGKDRCISPLKRHGVGRIGSSAQSYFLTSRPQCSQRRRIGR
jgi:hypothetical protein